MFGVKMGSKEPLGSYGDVPVDMSDQSKAFNVQAYRLGNQRANEIEGVKAMAISMSRHEKWKAGGPN